MTMALLGEGRQADISLSTRDGDVHIDEMWNYIVEADTFHTKLEVSQCPGLPQINQTLSSAGLTVCQYKDGHRREANPRIWDFTARFSTRVEENSDQTQLSFGANPETWRPVRRLLKEALDEVRFKDASGTAIVNSAGQPFDTGLVFRRYIPVWEFAQFEPASVTDEDVLARNEVVNATTYKGTYAAKTMLCVVMDSVLGYYYGQRRRLTIYQLKYNSETWRVTRLDVGTSYLDGGVLKRYEKDGQTIHGGLNGSGARVSDGTAPAILYFDRYPTSSFSFLRI